MFRHSIATATKLVQLAQQSGPTSTPLQASQIITNSSRRFTNASATPYSPQLPHPRPATIPSIVTQRPTTDRYLALSHSFVVGAVIWFGWLLTEHVTATRDEVTSLRNELKETNAALKLFQQKEQQTPPQQLQSSQFPQLSQLPQQLTFPSQAQPFVQIPFPQQHQPLQHQQRHATYDLHPNQSHISFAPHDVETLTNKRPAVQIFQPFAQQPLQPNTSSNHNHHNHSYSLAPPTSTVQYQILLPQEQSQ